MRAAATVMGAALRGRARRLAAAKDAQDLSATEGFRVRNRQGEVGIVDGVRGGPSGHFAALAIRSGRSGALVLLLPFEKIEHVDRDAQEVLISEEHLADYVPQLGADGCVTLRAPRDATR